MQVIDKRRLKKTGGKMKLKLISPGFRDMRSTEFKALMYRFWFPTLSLPMIAALTPDNFEISFCDELFERLDFNEDVDIVGITGMTAQICRAYEIADRYREKGVPVIIGGIHASTLPEEAGMHADCVIIGEAENIWPEAIRDFMEGNLRPVYKSMDYVELDNIPWAKREIYTGKNIPKSSSINSVQTSRGCPFDCSFCSVTRFFGNKYRLRPVDNVIEEIKSLKGKFVSLVDDNIIGSQKYAEELFIKLSELGFYWTGQSSINIADNDKLLDLCARSGCNGLLIGIESIDEENLKSINKKVNRVYKYMESIKKIQDKGIKVLGSFILGLDEDDASVFERTIKFIKETDIAVPIFNILTPYPGTRIYNKLMEENRIITNDWSYYTSTNVVYMPRKMTPDELLEGYRWSYAQVHIDISSNINIKPVGWF